MSVLNHEQTTKFSFKIFVKTVFQKLATIVVIGIGWVFIWASYSPVASKN